LRIFDLKSILSNHFHDNDSEKIKKRGILLSTEYKKRRDRILRRRKSLLKNLKEIKITLHRVHFSGDYDYYDLEEKLGPLRVIRTGKTRRKDYSSQSTRQIGKYQLTIFTIPSNYRPKCILEISYPKTRFIYDLYIKFPELKMTCVEYTIDLFFKNNKKIPKYFKTLRRDIWFPSQRTGYLRADEKLKSKIRQNNAFFSTKKLKFYERGPDKLQVKVKKFYVWSIEDLDRIRIEFRAYRKDLEKYGIQKLVNFKDDPKFDSVMANRFGFKKFKFGIAHLPTEFDSYAEKDKYGHTKAFHNEYLAAKGNLKNISQYLEDVEDFQPLMEDIKNRIKIFGKRWRESARKLDQS